MGLILAFTGKKRHGKSTACEYIQEKYPNAVRVNFKDAMVREITEKFPNMLRELCALMEKIDYDGMNPWTRRGCLEINRRCLGHSCSTMGLRCVGTTMMSTGC